MTYPDWYDPKHRVLCVCEGGNVRSVAMMHALHGHPHHPLGDVIAVGARVLSPESWDIFGTWAQTILVIGQSEIVSLIPDRFRSKVYHVDIGADHWGNPTNPALVHELNERLYHERPLRAALGWQ